MLSFVISRFETCLGPGSSFQKSSSNKSSWSSSIDIGEQSDPHGSSPWVNRSEKSRSSHGAPSCSFVPPLGEGGLFIRVGGFLFREMLDECRALSLVGVVYLDSLMVALSVGVVLPTLWLGVLHSVHSVSSSIYAHDGHVVDPLSLSQYRVHFVCLQIGKWVVEVVPSWLNDTHPLTCPLSSVIGSGSMLECGHPPSHSSPWHHVS